MVFWIVREETPLLDPSVAWCPAVRKRRAWSNAGRVIAFCHHQILIRVESRG
jgi:hypothetical protein